MSGTGTAGHGDLLRQPRRARRQGADRRQRRLRRRAWPTSRERCGAVVDTIEAPWGQRARRADNRRRRWREAKPKLVGVVHAETSTGALQPLDEHRKLVHESGALLLVDCVTTLGGVPVRDRRLGRRRRYSGTQKCLSCPPGLVAGDASASAPWKRIDARKTEGAELVSRPVDGRANTGAASASITTPRRST